jgi:hypothetical protein
MVNSPNPDIAAMLKGLIHGFKKLKTAQIMQKLKLEFSTMTE